MTVVNTLGVEGLEDSDFQEHSGEDAIGALDAYANVVRQGFKRSMAKSSNSVHTVCQCTKHVSRFNADTTGADCNQLEGKAVILATVHDTFQH